MILLPWYSSESSTVGTITRFFLESHFCKLWSALHLLYNRCVGLSFKGVFSDQLNRIADFASIGCMSQYPTVAAHKKKSLIKCGPSLASLMLCSFTFRKFESYLCQCFACMTWLEWLPSLAKTDDVWRSQLSSVVTTTQPLCAAHLGGEALLLQTLLSKVSANA